MVERVIECPFCHRLYPIPLEVEEHHICECGAIYGVYRESTLPEAVIGLISTLFKGELPDLTDIEQFCRVAVYENFEEMLPKPDFSAHITFPLNLIWVTKNE